MNIQGKTIWQVAAGNGKDTHYAKLCLQNDVIIIGPGQYGSWPGCEVQMRAEGWSARRVGIVRRFAENIKSGDIIVLRVGTQEVYGVGEVVGVYGHSELFRDIQEPKWDLQHYRRVRWVWHQDGVPKVFPVYSLKLGNSVQEFTSPNVRRWLEALNVLETAYKRPLHELPTS